MHTFDINEFDYDLPEELIAQTPARERQDSRLLLVDPPHNRVKDLSFTDITSLIDRGDVLLFNDTRVFPARLSGRKETGGMVEILLLGYPLGHQQLKKTATVRQTAEAEALIKSSKRPKAGARITIGPDLGLALLEELGNGKARVRLDYEGNLADLLDRHGKMPLPPYIRRPEGEVDYDRQRYQTLFATNLGAVAAPTAGLHFSREILHALRGKGVHFAAITLHVGYGTFAPVRTQDIRLHAIHSEQVSVGPESAQTVNRAKKEGRRIWCVGTTATRAIEFCADDSGMVIPYTGPCNLYIYPGYRFKIVDRLLTNFHLPKSSLLFLVAALAGRENILRAYRHAVEKKYRFFSYGDAMLILR